MRIKGILLLTALSLLASQAGAAPFEYIRIGDQDGFGYKPTAGYLAANGGAADTNGNNLLEQTEFLPDLNTDGAVAWNKGDNFDNRSAAEIADTGSLNGSGFTDSGTSGYKWTDISLSKNYVNPDFPDPAGSGTPNEPTFEFDFFVATGDIVAGSTLFFNLIFGDYDVTPADIDLTFASEPARSVSLSTQAGTDDGLIQAATANMTFDEVFTATAGGWDGYLRVDFDAPNEPYTAFDFVELSLDEIPFVPTPEPASLALFGGGLLALGLARRRRRR
ncbi:MAG: PEP-CTERM sorting domain-containing protein [Alphaproteobacteria bacterium]|jgi:hypothetical protein|nr:PEP-CTERM sorting domain-containing protein [Alphaproteobacteria bacterium]MDP6565178.1 PEP-CTERM sorting domain-containing protein [Alphaproteobacteria bacterium]MDP6812301.1 PEP-CTERM sorting domain-containing protein [Alphaproteobacteria bacterium]